jgi:putative tryptophan/tyrosine transport system substrate-binding protein
MRRREFIALIGGAAAWPLTARAQQPTLPVVGFLNGASPGPYAYLVRAFRQGLSEMGYVEGRNLAIEYRWAELQYDRLEALAADLVHRKVAVIAANTPAALPAKAATATIPIVFVTSVDPVEAGLVASLNRPGGNLTGVSFLSVELGAKRLELLHELVPTAATLAALTNPNNPAADSQSKELESAARARGLKLHILHASNELDLDIAFASLDHLRVDGLVIAEDGLFNIQRQRLVVLAARHQVPVVYPWHEAPAEGGLISYGTSLSDTYRQMGVYAGRILNGDKPAELPILQPAAFELVINVRIARVLGLAVPPTLLAAADEVIE